MRAGCRPLALALMVLWLALAGNFAGTAHWLLVPHRMCEVHNQWEHGTGQESSPASAAPTPSAPTRDPIYRSEGRAHDECPLSSFARIEPSLPEVHLLAESVLPLERATGLCVVAAERRSSIALLALAPKHSPPA